MKKSTLKRIGFATCAIIGLLNLAWFFVGFSFLVLLMAAEVFGKKVTSGSAWEEISHVLVTTYMGLPSIVLIGLWLATILGFIWVAYNWQTWKKRYWESSTPTYRASDPMTQFEVKNRKSY